MSKPTQTTEANQSDEEYFKENGGYKLTAISFVGLLFLVGGNVVGPYAPWPSLILIVVGIMASIYAGDDRMATDLPRGTSGGGVRPPQERTRS